MQVWFVVVLVIVALGVGAYWQWSQKVKRREELARMALQLGLEYSREDPYGMLGLPFALLRKGDGRGCENVLTGSWHDVSLWEFDYWYYDESTDSNGHTSRTYHRFSCAVTEIAALCSPLTIEHETVFTRMADHLGFEDIRFESERFNREFNVRSKDPKFANDAIDSRMMEWLLGAGSAWGFELAGGHALCYSRKRRPTELIPLLGTLEAFTRRIPRVVFELYGAAEAG